MAHDVELVIRGGLVVDGTGAEPFEADIAVDAAKIVRVSETQGLGRSYCARPMNRGSE